MPMSDPTAHMFESFDEFTSFFKGTILNDVVPLIKNDSVNYSGDGRLPARFISYGDYDTSSVLHDFSHCMDFVYRGKPDRLAVFQFGFDNFNESSIRNFDTEARVFAMQIKLAELIKPNTIPLNDAILYQSYILNEYSNNSFEIPIKHRKYSDYKLRRVKRKQWIARKIGREYIKFANVDVIDLVGRTVDTCKNVEICDD